LKNANRISKGGRFSSSEWLGVAVRAAAVVVLAGAGWWMTNRPVPPPKHVVPASAVEQDWRAALPMIDADVESLLTRHGVDRKRLKKKYYNVADANFSRIERTVEMWPDFASILVNQELNGLASKYGARGVATENTLGRSIAMHVEYHGYVVETINFIPAAKR
jgi:hypothetical protein